MRFCDLRLRIEDSPAASDVRRLHAELDRRGIRFRPHAWLSTEWFSPDGVPGIAIPFYVAHPRLRRLEQRMMGEVEGGSRKWRRRILRHEAGHALDTAYRLRRRADWRRVFGPASKRYPSDYSVRPGSRGYVLHLGYWYAQSHPTEDFAETFAVWLQPKARWRREYAEWPALRKLEYVDGLVETIAANAPPNRDRSTVAPLSANRRTLGEHYRRKRAFYERIDRRYDGWIEEVFVAHSERPRAVPAHRFIRTMEPPLRRLLLRRTRVSPYLIEHVIEMVRQRTRQLDLAAPAGRRATERAVAGLHERVIVDMLRRNREHYVL